MENLEEQQRSQCHELISVCSLLTNQEIQEIFCYISALVHVSTEWPNPEILLCQPPYVQICTA
jgi:hypothetical protein